MAAPPPPPTTTSTSSSHQDSPQPHLHHIKSAARKLPVKRKPNPPRPNPSPSSPSNLSAPEPDGFDGDDAIATSDAKATTERGGNDSAVPFKFHRIWSESDEVRFLQGLLACRSQGLAFPRDLNMFFDTFSETMTQPYTRSQLSEKLRRLRKKFRVVSSRVARGLDPSTSLSSHDRDLYHLSTQLWHPSHADSSPFVASGPDASKRRRRLPPPPMSGSNSHNTDPSVLDDKQNSALPAAAPLGPRVESADYDDKDGVFSSGEASAEQGIDVGDWESVRHSVGKAVLNVFDSSVKEMQMTLFPTVMSRASHRQVPGGSGGALLRRWQEQRAAELGVFARRLRLVIENGLAIHPLCSYCSMECGSRFFLLYSFPSRLKNISFNWDCCFS